MYISEVKAELLRLLADSPIASPDVIELVREFVHVGEEGLAFDTLCSSIHEDDLPISRSFYERLVAIAPEVGMEESLDGLEELVREH
ncbi:MafI family immunity protein [Micromonospora mangrovi]|uniref:MafI family immunity protein n=2 Tax=Micromonospora TaxID=1873 RepID=A0AAU7MCA7_9ACTN